MVEIPVQSKASQLLTRVFQTFFEFALLGMFLSLLIYLLTSLLWFPSAENQLALTAKSLILGVTTEIISVLLIYIFSYRFIIPFQEVRDAHLAEELVNRIGEQLKQKENSGNNVQNQIDGGSTIQDRSDAVYKLLTTLLERSNKPAQNQKTILTRQDLHILVQLEVLTTSHLHELTKRIQTRPLS